MLVPLLSCFWIAYSVINQKQRKGFVLATQGLFVGVLWVLVGSLFVIWREKFEFEDINSYEAPYDLSFFSVQILGVLGAVLITYTQTLPKA